MTTENMILVNYDVVEHAELLVSRGGICGNDIITCTCDECFISSILESEDIEINCSPQTAYAHATELLNSPNTLSKITSPEIMRKAPLPRPKPKMRSIW